MAQPNHNRASLRDMFLRDATRIPSIQVVDGKSPFVHPLDAEASRP